MKIYRTKGNEIVTTGVGRLALIVSGKIAYTDEVWREYVALCRTMTNPATPFLGVFNYSPSVSPTASQRKYFEAELGDLNRNFKRVSVISDSALVRGALTAVAWLSRGETQLKAFTSAQTDQAFTWLGESLEFDLQLARATLQDMIKQQSDGSGAA